MTSNIKITKDMTSAVCNALIKLVQAKGKRNGMATLEAIEEQMHNDGVDMFVPVRLTLSALISKSYVRYFQMENGRLVFGFTKSSQEKIFGELVEEPELTQAQ